MCFCTEFLLNMPIDNARTKSLFRKLERLAGKLVRDPQPDDVHQFRTSTRRIEAVLHELVAEPGRSERKPSASRIGRCKDESSFRVPLPRWRANSGYTWRFGKPSHRLLTAANTNNLSPELLRKLKSLTGK